MRFVLFHFARVSFQFVSADCIDYLKAWTVQLKHTENFSWVLLQEIPKWESVEKTLSLLIESKHIEDADDISAKVFEQFTYVTQQITEEMIKEWSQGAVEADQRWIICFEKASMKQTPFSDFSAIVEYAFSLPGTSAPVERVFSAINQIWTT